MTKKKISILIHLFLFWMLVSSVSKAVFLILYEKMCGNSICLTDWIETIFRGIPTDFVIFSPLLAVSAFALAASHYFKGRTVIKVWSIICFILTFCIVSAYLLFITLYESWGILLDNYPYFATQNASTGKIFNIYTIYYSTGFIFIALLCWLLTVLQKKMIRPAFNMEPGIHRNRRCNVILLVTGLLIMVPLISDFTSHRTNKIGDAFYSENIILNHATVNPLYSLIHSLLKPDAFDKQYRFMDDTLCKTLSDSLINTSSEGTDMVLNTSRPNIYMILMESWSMSLWETDAIPNLKKITDSSLFFVNFFSNTFRTDRAMVSVLSGFPAQPNTTLIMYHDKCKNLTSVAGHLSDAGYSLLYYYGGFAVPNRRIYVECSGFPNMITMNDFPDSVCTCVWGVPDEILMSKALDDTKKIDDTQPVLCFIQLSSSHEPFDAPYHKFENKRLNAFAYTDHCIGKFIEDLKEAGKWDNSLIILFGDHWGCYPDTLSQSNINKQHVPMVWTGGAIDSTALIRYGDGITTYGSEQDIAATLFGQMKIPHDDFIFSKDMLNPNVDHFAFFSVPDVFGIVNDSACAIYDNRALKPIFKKGTGSDDMITYGQAYLQRLYDEIEKL